MSISIPNEYGYVLLAATSTFFVNSAHAVLTSRARKASGQAYPITYASNDLAEKDPKAYKFNCAQRAHANFTESLTPFLGGLLISGLRYPLLAASVGAAWSVGRVAYAFGYVRSGPKGRGTGAAIGSISDLILKGLAAYTAYLFARGQ